MTMNNVNKGSWIKNKNRSEMNEHASQASTAANLITGSVTSRKPHCCHPLS